MPFFPDPNEQDTLPRGVLEGSGTRAFMHNLIANPDIAKKYMASLGNDIKSYGKPGTWDWAWKEPGEGKGWIPASSQGFSGFLLDHIADAVIGLGTGAAAILGAGAGIETGPGALATGAAAGGAASGLLEAGRQEIGHLAGVPDNLDTGQIAGAAIGGALAEPTGAAIGGIVRGAGRLAGKALGATGRFLPEFAAKIADIQPLNTTGVEGTTGGAVLKAGAELTQGGRIPLLAPEVSGKSIRDTIRFIGRAGIPEIKEADRRVLAQAANNLTVDLDNTMSNLRSYTYAARSIEPKVQEALGSSKTLDSDVTNLVERLRNATGFEGHWAETPVEKAVMVRRILQNEAFGKGAYEGAGPSQIYGQVVKTAGAQARTAIEAAMAPVDPTFAPLMARGYDALKKYDFFREALRMSDYGPKGDAAATRFVLGVYGKSKVNYLEALNDLENHFASATPGALTRRALSLIQRSQRDIYQANLGERIGARGTGELLPHITGGGHVKSAMAALGAGYLIGGFPGMAVGATLASPKFILRAAGPIAAAGQVAQNATSALARAHLGGASRVIATGVLSAGDVAAMRGVIRSEGGGSKGIVRQEEGKTPKRQIVIGR